MDTRKISIYLIVGFLLGSSIIVAASHLTNTSTVSDGVTLGAPDGMNATITGETQAQLEQPFPDSSTVEFTTEDGNISFSSSGPAWAAVNKDEITGPWTNVTSIDATSNDVTVNPGDKSSVTVGDNIDVFNFTGAYAIDDGSVDFVYEGAGGTSEVQISGVDANTRIAAIDANTGNILDESTSDGSGSITFSELDDGTHAVYLQEFDPSAPQFANESPSGDLDSEPSEISVDVSDRDFPRGDEVDVTISLDGSQIHSETITANQTITTNIPQSGQNGGAHSWTVDAQDDFGESQVTTFSYNVPDTLTIRNETNHSEIIDSPVENTVTFFGEDEIFQRNTTDGTINMTGLPVNQDFIVGVNPTGNYTSRTVYIQSIYEQQDVYLLNMTTYNTFTNRFILEDPTGQYGSDTILYIQRPITINGSTSWQTIHADQFGTEGVTATLQEDGRYRIKVMSSDGVTQIVGPYRADLSETVTVQPGPPTIEIGDMRDGWGSNAELNNRTLEYRYSDSEQQTDQVTVYIHEKNNKSNQLQPNETYFDLGNFTAQSTLSENESEKTWVVTMVVDRDGEEFITRDEVSNKADLVPDLSREWRLITGVGLLLLLAGAFSMLNANVGAVVVSIVGGILWWIGYLDGATTGAAVVIALFISLIGHIYSSAR